MGWGSHHQVHKKYSSKSLKSVSWAWDFQKSPGLPCGIKVSWWWWLLVILHFLEVILLLWECVYRKGKGQRKWAIVKMLYNRVKHTHTHKHEWLEKKHSWTGYDSSKVNWVTFLRVTACYSLLNRHRSYGQSLDNFLYNPGVNYPIPQQGIMGTDLLIVRIEWEREI